MSQDRGRQRHRQTESTWRFKEALSSEEMVTSQAQSIAQTLVKEGLTSTQLRRFFHEIRRLQALTGSTEEEFLKARPYVKMVHSKAAYASRNRDFPSSFYKFLSSNIEDIASREDFDKFIQYFEAVVGYFYAYSEGALRRELQR